MSVYSVRAYLASQPPRAVYLNRNGTMVAMHRHCMVIIGNAACIWVDAWVCVEFVESTMDALKKSDRKAYNATDTAFNVVSQCKPCRAGALKRNYTY